MATSTLVERDESATETLPLGSDRGRLALVSENHGLPTISLPETFEFTRCGWLIFTIQTEAGAVSIEASSRRFFAKGSADALQQLRLVRPEWLPGQPGCGKVRQTVGFDANGPHLVFEKGRRTRISSICITRKSKTTYKLEIPTTEHQAVILEKAIEEHTEQKNREQEKREAIEREKFEDERRSEKFKSPANFRSYMVDWVTSSEGVLSYHFREAGEYYRFSDETIKRIEDGLREIRKVMSEGVVIPGKKVRNREKNVIFIGQR
jgi:hypothetical protein